MRPFSLTLTLTLTFTLTLTLTFTLTLLILASAPAALAQSGTASGATTGSGTNAWDVRAARAEGFAPQWERFAPVFASWRGKWEKAAAKQSALFSRCALDVRSANRDTLLPATLQCYKGQLLIEQEALKRERETVVQWPGIPEEARAEHLRKIDALLDALAPIIDGIDAKVFSTMTAFRDVRKNLLTQYRQPYWLSAAHLRAHAVQTWTAHLLVALRTLTTDGPRAPAVLEKLQAALACYESVEAMAEESEIATTIPAAHEAFSRAGAQAAGCPALLRDAENLQQQSSSVPSVR